MLQRPWLRWTLVFAGWTCVALFFASQTYLLYRSSGGQAHTGIILKINLGSWYLWGLLAPAIIWLARRVPLEREHWARSSTIHLIAGIGVAVLKWWLDNLFRHYILTLPVGLALEAGPPLRCLVCPVPRHASQFVKDVMRLKCLANKEAAPPLSADCHLTRHCDFHRYPAV
jgi:hypothetical protein